MKDSLNLLKTMLKTSYDMGKIINPDTKKLNKKSIKVWITGIVCVIVIYLSYAIINSLKSIGMSAFFLDMFFMLLQFLISFETILLAVSVLYFSDDIENYLCLPISSMKLLLTRFSVILAIIFGTEIIIALPSIFIYASRTMQGFWFYPLAVIVISLISIFLSTIISILMIFVMKIFRFVKSKYLYRNIIILSMTFIVFTPMISNLNRQMLDIQENVLVEQSADSEETEKIQLENLLGSIKNVNKSFIVTNLGVNALVNVNYQSIIYVLEILGLDLLALIIFLIIGKFTYINDVLFNISMLSKKKHTRIRINTRCKAKNSKYAYLINEIRVIIKNPTYFMNYIYKVLAILGIFVMIAMVMIPIVIQTIKEIGAEWIFDEISFEFSEFSLIIGVIQAIFIISSLSLTAISRYGKNAIFFKYIPMKYKTQFRLKNIPQLLMNTVIIISVLYTVYCTIPAIDNIYFLLMFIVAMLLNIINTNILLFLDLLRPKLNYENDITVIKQNDNKLFQYILTVGMCIVLWYIKEVMKDESLNLCILVEIIVFSIIVVGMEIFINRKSNKLFRKII